MATLKTALLSLVLAYCPFASASADPLLADFQYPYPVQCFEFRSQRQLLSMAYMDVRADQTNGKTVVMLRGKNFCGATWAGVIGWPSARCGLPHYRPRPDRLLQIDKASGL